MPVGERKINMLRLIMDYTRFMKPPKGTASASPAPGEKNPSS
jgi:hypothetical protein